jgi:ATPase subunit of ABC transporter with duplicated ATPase domains
MPASSATPHATLVARHLHHEQGGHVVLSDVSLSVGPGTCLGVIGPNGVGKSTLLQILAGLLVPTAGEVRVDPPTASVGYLAQEHAHAGDETVSAALNRRAGIAAVEMELTAAASGLAAGGHQAEDRYAAALARYEAASAGDFEARLVSACTQVDLPPDVAQQPVSTLSGGQEARMALAAILLARFDLTLLDEPTNDLDFEGLSRLEDIVARRTGGMIIVSHDRAFLERRRLGRVPT